jgi:hypothetical protein
MASLALGGQEKQDRGNSMIIANAITRTIKT